MDCGCVTGARTPASTRKACWRPPACLSMARCRSLYWGGSCVSRRSARCCSSYRGWRCGGGGSPAARGMGSEPLSDDYVLYDGQCPACAHYIAATGLAGGADVKLVDARAHPALVAEHAAAGRSIDESMVVAIGGVMHYGADATRKLAEIGQPTTRWQRSLLWFVGKAPWADALYPALAAGRRGLLRILGRPLIDRR